LVPAIDLAAAKRDEHALSAMLVLSHWLGLNELPGAPYREGEIAAAQTMTMRNLCFLNFLLALAALHAERRPDDC